MLAYPFLREPIWPEGLYPDFITLIVSEPSTGVPYIHCLPY